MHEPASWLLSESIQLAYFVSRAGVVGTWIGDGEVGSSNLGPQRVLGFAVVPALVGRAYFRYHFVGAPSLRDAFHNIITCYNNML